MYQGGVVGEVVYREEYPGRGVPDTPRITAVFLALPLYFSHYRCFTPVLRLFYARCRESDVKCRESDVKCRESGKEPRE